MPQPSSSFCGDPAMAVRTAHFAFGDLVRNAGPCQVEHGRNVVLLVSDVVKLQYQWVRLTAIYARMLKQIVSQSLRVGQPALVFCCVRAPDVNALIFQIMHAIVEALARAASAALIAGRLERNTAVAAT